MQEEVAKEIFENFSDFQKIAVPLIVLLSMNLVVYVLKFILDNILKTKDAKIHKINLISAKKIDVQEKLFQRFDSLSLFSQNQKESFFESIQSTEQFLNQNKIFIDKKIYSLSNKMLDYYKSIYFDHRQKKYELEIIMFDEFYKLFNK